MKIEEFRVGNLVEYSRNEKIVKIKGFSYGGLHVTSEDEMIWKEIESFNSIPLTRNWLISAGFVRQGETMYNKKDLFIIYVPEMIHYKTETKIKYVHQLQNLYFAITGEELKL